MKRSVLIPTGDEPPERRTGTYNEQEAVRYDLAFTAVDYHPAKPILGFVDLAHRYTESLNWGHFEMTHGGVVEMIHSIMESPALGEISIDNENGWVRTDEAVQIGVIWPKDRVPQGVFMRGQGCAPKHRMEVCLKTISPRDAHDFQSVLQGETEMVSAPKNNAVHTRLSQVMARLIGFIANGDWDEGGAFGICGETENLAGLINSARSDASSPTIGWKGRLYAPQRFSTTSRRYADAIRRGWEMGDAIWTNIPSEWDGETNEWEGFPRVVEHDENPFVVQELPPIYKERRASIHINLGGDFWVEETRCPKCAQRLIIHTPASMCPSGHPVGLTVKCGDCKHSFGWP